MDEASEEEMAAAIGEARKKEASMDEAGEEEPVLQWHVYMVACADGTLYTGVTNRLDSRVAKHNAGRGAKYTRTRRPVQLVYAEATGSRGAALKREHQIKRLTRDGKRQLIA
jgi:putative endonuclease